MGDNVFSAPAYHGKLSGFESRPSSKIFSYSFCLYLAIECGFFSVYFVYDYSVQELMAISKLDDIFVTGFLRKESL
jgi:hypothetical protein